MIEWREKRIIPKIETVHILDGYDNPCESCEEWRRKCEFCNAFVPLTSDYEVKEVTMAKMTICGIPVGTPYEVDSYEEV